MGLQRDDHTTMGIRLSSAYVSDRKLTKSIVALKIFIFAVSKCLDLSGLLQETITRHKFMIKGISVHMLMRQSIVHLGAYAHYSASIRYRPFVPQYKIN
jgi:hypothetical protein